MRTAARRWLPLGAAVAVLLPMIVTSSQPRLPPSHWFTASGFVLPASGGSAANYTVVLMGRGWYFGSEWARLDLSYDSMECQHDAQDVMITRATGAFWLSACLGEKPDSLAAAVVLPDTLIMGVPVSTAVLHRDEVEGSDEVDGFLCDDTVTYIAYYSYEPIDSLIVPVP